jgi:tetratricopeptide (TPR) repeat protein
LADALAFIHGRGICHLDLKPSNVLLSPNGTPRLLDFNLSFDSRKEQWRLGGTLPYMAPEHLQATDRHASPKCLAVVGPGADVFSLGILLYKLATGKHPFGPLPMQLPSDELRKLLVERHQRGAKPVQQGNPDVDAALASLIEQCLNCDPEDRPSAATIASKLRGQLRPAAQARRWVRRNPRKTLTALVAFVFLGVTAFGAIAMTPSAHERHHAAGVAEFERGNFEQAKICFTSAIEAAPELAQAYFGRARASQMLGANDRTALSQAIEDYQRAEKLSPDGRNHAAMGYCWNLLSKHGTAQQCYEEALSAGFANAKVYTNLGYCYYRGGEYERSADTLTKAIQLDGQLGIAHYARAIVLSYRAKNSSSKLAFLQQQPQAQFGPGQIAKMQADLATDLNQALTDVQNALALCPPNGEMSWNAARLYSMASERDPKYKAAALSHLTSAVRDQGYPSSRLAGDPFLAAIAAEPEFKAILRTPERAQPAATVPRFLDPI